MVSRSHVEQLIVRANPVPDPERLRPGAGEAAARCAAILEGRGIMQATTRPTVEEQGRAVGIPERETAGRWWRWGDRPPRRGLRIAFAAALIVLLAVGGTALLLTVLHSEPEVVDEPTTVTTTATSLPAGGDLSIATIDSGPYFAPVSVAVGRDGLPVLAYNRPDAATLVIATCRDPSCTEDPVLREIPAVLSSLPSLVLDPRGAPVVAFFDEVEAGRGVVESNVELVICSDPLCSDFTRTTIAGGYGPLLAIGADGLPVVLYTGGDDLPYLVSCRDPACADRTTVPLGLEGRGWLDLTVNPEGVPVIAWLHNNLERRIAELDVLYCGDLSCSTQSVHHVADAEVNSGSVDIAIGADGNPVVAFGGERQLQVATCGDPACASLGTVMDVGPRMIIAAGSGFLAVDRDGNPVIAFAAASAPDEAQLPVVAVCDDPQCISGTIATLDDASSAGVALALTGDGYPVVVYGGGAGAIYVAVCRDARCAAGALDVVSWDQTPATTTTYAAGPAGLITEGWTKIPLSGGGYLIAVAAADSGLVTVGEDCVVVSENSVCESALWLSPDGLAWERVSGVDFAGGKLFDVTDGPAGLVAVGSTCRNGLPARSGSCESSVWTSADGSSWEQTILAAGVFEGCEAPGCWPRLERVTSGGPGYVAAGEDAAGGGIWVSADGVTWGRASYDPEALKGAWVADIVQAGSRLVVLATGYEDIYENGEWVDMSARAIVLVSEDGLEWTVVEDQPLFAGGDFSAPAAVWNEGVAVPGSVCDENWECESVMWNSPDGITWSRSTFSPALEEGVSVQRIAPGGPGLIGAGQRYDELANRDTGLFWTSSDGVTWDQFAADPEVFPEGVGINDFATIDGRLVGVGWSYEDRGPGIYVWSP